MWDWLDGATDLVHPKNFVNLFNTDTNTGTVTIHNDTLQDVNIDTPGSGHMKKSYPKTTIGRDSGVTNQIEGSIFEQSWFDLTFNGNHQIHTELNHGDRCSIASRPQPEDGKVAAMISRISSSSSQLDYFVGPGQLQSLINSVIQANLPAFMAFLNPGIDLNPTDLVCPYAAVTNVTQNSVDVNAVLRLQKASASLAVAGTNVSASLNDLAIMVRLHVDNLTHRVTLNEIKFSVAAFSLPKIFWPALFIWMPWLPQPVEFDTVNNLSVYLNHDANQDILNFINGQLDGLPLPKMLDKISFTSEPSTTIGSAPPANDDFSTWMSSPDIQSRLLKNVHLPGTHDSGAYGLTTTLPKTTDDGNGIKYDNIQFLWGLKTDAAFFNGNIPFSKLVANGFKISEDSPINIGQPAMDFVIEKVALSISKTGDRNVLRQLEDGIRWFDLRIYLDKDGEFYMQHGLRGPLYTDILKQVKVFIDSYPSAQELIFLNLSHGNFKDDNLQKVADLTKSIIPPKHVLHKGNEAGATFNFQSLANTTLGSLTQSTTKVMIINQNVSNNLYYPFPITNTVGFDDANDQALWHMGWCRTPTIEDIVPYVIDTVRGVDRMHLQTLATEKNGKLKDGLSQLDQKKPMPNVIDLDWYYLSSKDLPVPQVIGLNK